MTRRSSPVRRHPLPAVPILIVISLALVKTDLLPLRGRRSRAGWPTPPLPLPLHWTFRRPGCGRRMHPVRNQQPAGTRGVLGIGGRVTMLLWVCRMARILPWCQVADPRDVQPGVRRVSLRHRLPLLLLLYLLLTCIRLALPAHMDQVDQVDQVHRQI